MTFRTIAPAALFAAILALGGFAVAVAGAARPYIATVDRVTVVGSHVPGPDPYGYPRPATAGYAAVRFTVTNATSSAANLTCTASQGANVGEISTTSPVAAHTSATGTITIPDLGLVADQVSVICS